MEKKVDFDNLTQADIIKLMLQNAQHMVTREELKIEIKDSEERLNEKIDNVEKRLNEKIDNVEKRLNEKIEALDKKIDNVEKRLNEKIDILSQKVEKIEAKFDRLTWLIIATIISIFAKDYILELIKNV